MRFWFEKVPGPAGRTLATKTAAVTLTAVVASLGVCAMANTFDSKGVPLYAWICSVIMPALTAGPLTYYLLNQQRKLREAYAKLHLLASTDALTECLSRGAFTRQVTERLRSLDDLAPTDSDAFLVIDADNFKRINDTFGHDQGDEALQHIAAAIRANVRRGDIVGRIGGEEFGAFLADADLPTATSIAERIRVAITALHFAPEGALYRLSVSIGGAVVHRPADFGDVYRLADQKLYAAKHGGRDRVAMLRAA